MILLAHKIKQPAQVCKKIQKGDYRHGIETSKSKIRQSISTEVARLAYEGWDPIIFEKLPYQIIPGKIVSEDGIGFAGSGCVAGAGTIAPARKATEAVNRLKANSNNRFGVSSKYKKYLTKLENKLNQS